MRKRIGAKSETGWNTSREGMRGAPGLVMYQRSVAAATAEQRCMSGRRFATETSGLMSREIQGPVRGVRRRMIRSWEICCGVCVELEPASGCVIQSLVRAWVLRVLVERLQFLQWESEQSKRSDVDPKGQEMEGFPHFL